jgi:DNA-directed RNA polymerase specialized sigma24 family protein
MHEFSQTPDERAAKQAQTQHFQALLKRAQGGSQEAAQELHDTYVKYVHKCVRHKMWKRLRTRYDSADFVQQVWASFFADGSRLPDFETPADLIAFLQKVAQRKVLLEGRRQHRQKGNVEREMRIDEQASHVLGPHPATHDPTPSAVAVYREEYDRLIEQQVPEVREVAAMRAEGSTFAEIAESLEIDESTARRFMRRLRRRGGQDTDAGE